MRRDGLAQGLDARRLAVVERGRRAARAAVERQPPLLERKAVDVAAAIGEVDRGVPDAARKVHRRSAPPAAKRESVGRAIGLAGRAGGRPAGT